MAATEFHTPTLTLSPPPHDGLLFWQYMLAGSLSGVVEHTSMFPIDTLKTHMQALRPSCPLNPPSLPSALRSLLHSHGIPGLYRGLSAMALGAAPAHAVYFSVYELSKQTLPHSSPFTPALSGVCATLMNDLVFTPMDVVKQRLQLGGGEYRGVWDCVRRVLREEGFGAFYASYRTTVVMNAPYTAVHFTVYEAAKRVMSPGVECEEGAVVHATAGAAAGALAAVVTTPLDVVKTQLQCQGVCGCDRFTNGSMQDVIQTILKRDGYRGLMRGWAPRMLFHAPAAAISWSTYEAGKSFFRKMNESSSHSSTS